MSHLASISALCPWWLFIKSSTPETSLGFSDVTICLSRSSIQFVRLRTIWKNRKRSLVSLSLNFRFSPSCWSSNNALTTSLSRLTISRALSPA